MNLSDVDRELERLRMRVLGIHQWWMLRSGRES